MNIIKYASEIAEEARARVVETTSLVPNADYAQAHKAVRDAAEKDHPVYVGLLDSVQYNEKVDKYVAKFNRSGTTKIDSAKISSDVAAFLLQHGRGNGNGGYPTINVHFADDGTVDGVFLLFLSR